MKVLVDTNVLVRSVEKTQPLKRIARDALRHLYTEGNELCVAPQNISEFWSVCTRPVKQNGLGNSVAVTDRLTSRIETLFTILPDSMEAFRQWRSLVVAHDVKGAKVHDTRLVATMIVYQIDTILTFNTADFVRYTGITVLDPAQL